MDIELAAAGSSLDDPVGVTGSEGAALSPLAVRPVPYAEWANRGATTMRLRFPDLNRRRQRALRRRRCRRRGR